MEHVFLTDFEFALFKQVVLYNPYVGEASLSYGYESSGKICASSNFSDYADPFGEGDVIGAYLVCINSTILDAISSKNQESAEH